MSRLALYRFCTDHAMLGPFCHDLGQYSRFGPHARLARGNRSHISPTRWQKLSRNEFDILLKVSQNVKETNYLNHFRAVDSNHDAYVTVEELQRRMTQLKGKPVSLASARHFMQLNDPNNDGKLNYNGKTKFIPTTCKAWTQPGILLIPNGILFFSSTICQIVLTVSSNYSAWLKKAMCVKGCLTRKKILLTSFKL